MPKPLALGDSEQQEFTLSREEHQLPKTRKEIIARIETLLGAGGVQRLVIELGRPIKVDRLVAKDSLGPTPEELPDDLWNQIHNNEMSELKAFGTWSAFQMLFFAFHEMSQKRLKPAKLFVPNLPLVRQWLKVDANFSLEQVFGVDVMARAELPADCVVLAAISFDEENNDTYAIRIPVDLPKEKK